MPQAGYPLVKSPYTFSLCNVYILQVTVFMSRTFNRRQGLIAGCVVAAVHLLFLLYLHFAYHSVYEGQ